MAATAPRRRRGGPDALALLHQEPRRRSRLTLEKVLIGFFAGVIGYAVFELLTSLLA